MLLFETVEPLSVGEGAWKGDECQRALSKKKSVSARTLVAISKSTAAVITSRIGPLSRSTAGIFPEITGRIGPSSRH